MRMTNENERILANLGKNEQNRIWANLDETGKKRVNLGEIGQKTGKTGKKRANETEPWRNRAKPKVSPNFDSGSPRPAQNTCTEPLHTPTCPGAATCTTGPVSCTTWPCLTTAPGSAPSVTSRSPGIYLYFCISVCLYICMFLLLF